MRVLLLILITALAAGATALGAKAVLADSFEEPSFDEVPSPINAAEVTRIVDQAIARHREMQAAVDDRRQHWLEREGLPTPAIQMLNHGTLLHETRLRLISEARHSIYLTTFHIRKDAPSRQVLDALCARAREGLEVRIMIERSGSDGLEAELRGARACGAKVLYLRTPLVERVFALHEKVLVIDGERLITGGSGYAGWYTTAGRQGHYDMDFVVEGPTACRTHRQYQASFRGRVRLDSIADPGVDYGLDRMYECDDKRLPDVAVSRSLPIWNDPLRQEARPILEAQLKSMQAALYSPEKKLRFYAPFFVPHPTFRKAIVEMVKKGFEVEVITNPGERQDSKLQIAIMLAMRDHTREFRRLGGKVRLWTGPGFMHRKGGMYGDAIANFGSDNFDSRGQDYSSEEVVFTDDRGVITQMKSEFDEDWASHTEPFDEAVIRRWEAKATPFHELLAAAIWRLI